jgi:hypothetical protein
MIDAPDFSAVFLAKVYLERIGYVQCTIHVRFEPTLAKGDVPVGGVVGLAHLCNFLHKDQADVAGSVSDGLRPSSCLKLSRTRLTSNSPSWGRLTVLKSLVASQSMCAERKALRRLASFYHHRIFFDSPRL